MTHLRIVVLAAAVASIVSAKNGASLKANAALVDDCYNNSGQIFLPWANNQLSARYCTSDFFGMSWCVANNATCLRNMGTLTGRGSYNPNGPTGQGTCLQDNPVCCWNDYKFCQGKTLDGRDVYGNCMQPGVCARSPMPEMGGDKNSCKLGTTCCTDDEVSTDYVACFDSYSEVIDKLYSNNMTQGITRGRMTNYLPYFGLYFAVIESEYNWDDGRCYSANYMAVAITMLKQFENPSQTYSQMLAALNSAGKNDTIADVKRIFASDGLVTPKTFSDLIQVLFMRLNIVYSGGTCADYQHATMAIYGVSASCDDAWKQLMTTFGCPPKA